MGKYLSWEKAESFARAQAQAMGLDAFLVDNDPFTGSGCACFYDPKKVTPSWEVRDWASRRPRVLDGDKGASDCEGSSDQ